MLARKRHPVAVKKGAPAHVNTYGYMVTLILCFFVLMLASLNVDAAKWKAALSSSMADSPFLALEPTGDSGILEVMGAGIMPIPGVTYQPGGEGVAEKQAKSKVNRRLSELAETLKAYTSGDNVKVVLDLPESMIRITFSGDMMFDRASAEIKPEVVSVLDGIAEEVMKHPDLTIEVEGHTDNTPISNAVFRNNLYLSNHRAAAVADYLIEQRDIDPLIIEIGGYGEYKPIATNDTPEGRARNRRVEINILGTQAIANELSET